MGGDLVAEVAVRRRAEPVNYAQTRRLANARICMPMSGRPFLWTRQKAGRLSG
jgi:hypothetical protein